MLTLHLAPFEIRFRSFFHVEKRRQSREMFLDKIMRLTSNCMVSLVIEEKFDM